jgi:succinyl-CoA synthetase beta subunit
MGRAFKGKNPAMMLLEHHGKEILAAAGVTVPHGVLATASNLTELARMIELPMVAKAQVPVGGRGKAGGILKVQTAAELVPTVEKILGLTIRNHPVRSVRLEAMVEFVAEAYFSLAFDADSATIKILVAAEGGVEIESPEMAAKLLQASAQPDIASAKTALESLLPGLPEQLRRPILELSERLIPLFFEQEALLVEINPLFITADGGWIAGDAKLLTDDNALPRQPQLRALIEANPDLYPEAALKLALGFDFVKLDPDGDVGLVTTGAGLSMQLVDEIVQRGYRPYNFCDIRTGGFKGDPSRLIQVLKWVSSGPKVRSILMNFFAGNTNLAELVPLILIALKEVPELRQPITLRMTGNGFDAACAILAEAGNPIMVETDLERAVDRALDVLKETAHA